MISAAEEVFASGVSLAWTTSYLEVLALQVALDLFVRRIQVGENLAQSRLKTVRIVVDMTSG